MNSIISNERLKALFATHPNTDVFYFTSDGMPFFDELAASSHAHRLQDKNVLEINRDELDSEEQGSFVDGLGDGGIISPALTADLAGFQQSEGGADLEKDGGVIVPASDILAQETNGAPAVEGNPTIIALNTPEAERTPLQKGLVTKFNNAAAANDAAATNVEGETI